MVAARLTCFRALLPPPTQLVIARRLSAATAMPLAHLIINTAMRLGKQDRLKLGPQRGGSRSCAVCQTVFSLTRFMIRQTK